MKDYGKKTGLFLLISLLAAGQTTAFGALSGSGTREDPVYGSPEIYPGDTVKPGAWFRSLTPVDGKTLVFSPVLSPREYQLIFDAEGGNIPQYGSRLSLRVRYNDGSGACSDTIQLPPEQAEQFRRAVPALEKGQLLLLVEHRHLGVLSAEQGAEQGVLIPQALLAEKVCTTIGMDKIFFQNSGTEANEAMIKMARKYFFF